MDGVPQGGRSGQRATFGRNPYLYISILKSGSDIPYSLIYAKRSGTVSSPPSGERRIIYLLDKRGYERSGQSLMDNHNRMW
jgi:hypothetical protein